MKPHKRSFVLSGLLIVLVGVALASGGLQLPKLVGAFTGIELASPQVQADEVARAAPARAVMLRADKEKYSLGEAVILTGSGWLPGETVRLLIHEDPTVRPDRSWTVTASASGEIFDNRLIMGSDGIKYKIVATGLSSGTSGIVILALPQDQQIGFIDFAQCANGPTPSTELGCVQWINGILNPNNSNYGENESVPQRAVWSVPLNTGGSLTGRTVDFTFQARKGDIHAYDFVTKYSNTQTNLLDNPTELCEGLAAENCVPALDPTASCFAVPADPTAVDDPVNNPALLTSGAQTLYTGTDEVCLWGGTITGISVPTHDKAGCTGPVSSQNCADDFANFIITYTVDPTFGGKIFLAYGGHTASSSYWGVGEGSSSVSGGPYHFRWTSADGTNFGGRDNQIQGSALVDTETPTPTNTPTNTPTDTPTNTPTDTPTDTPTNTPTDTPTDTPTPTPTDTPTNTPTDTPTNTPTNTPTDTPTPTPTNTPTNTPTPNLFSGCTPGFWKQPQHFDDWVGFTQNQTVESVFDVPDQCGLDNVTLLDALSLPGGKSLCGAVQNLLRAGVAALLNSSNPALVYPLSTAQVISEVNTALAGNRNDILAEAARLDAFNNFEGSICGPPPTATPAPTNPPTSPTP